MSFKEFIEDAEDALRVGNHELALRGFWAAAKLEPADPLVRMRLGLMLRRAGREQEALEEFTTVTKLSPEWGEAWREKGVIEGLIAREIPANKRPKWLHDGRASLERATRLNPNDFDAWASLGGVLKNVKHDDSAAEKAYWRAAEVSNWHPYPLLNALRLEAKRTGRLDLRRHEEHLKSAESLRRGQCNANPPADSPWCFYDVAEILLYEGKGGEFLESLERGIEHSTARWQIDTFRKSLEQIDGLGMSLGGLSEGINKLKEARMKSTPDSS